MVRNELEEVLGVLTFMASDPVVVKRQLDELRQFFGQGSRRAEVYLALDPNKNLTDVAESIQMKHQNVWREVRRLRERRLIIPLVSAGSGAIWVPNPTLERVLRLSSQVRQWFPSRLLIRPGTADADASTSDAAP